MNQFKNDSCGNENPLSKTLFINQKKIKNRIVKSATQENMADQFGLITQDYLDYYKIISSGGTGLIITGHMYVNIHGRMNNGMAGIDSNDQIPYLRKLSKIVHKNNSTIFAQLNHVGLKAIPEKKINKKIQAPSKMGIASSMSVQEIQDTINDFCQSASRIKKSGFDGIQIHCAHNFLIAQFLSRRTNRRKDKYGGSLKNRQSFCLELCKNIRDCTGDDFPVIVKLDSYSRSYASMPPFVSLISLDESLNTAKRLEEAGVDAIEVSCGFNANKGAVSFREPIKLYYDNKGESLKAKVACALFTPVDWVLNHNIWFKPHHNIEHIRIFKQNLSIPILAGSCFRDPVYMKQVIDKNEADMICMARPIVHDPNFPKKILSGYNDMSTCQNCNRCILSLSKNQPIKCHHKSL